MKCKACGAEIKLDPKSQKLVCEYCGSSFDVKNYEKEAKVAKVKDLLEPEKVEAKSYSCTQCGATLLTFDDTAVTFCSYCGSSMVIEPKLYKEEAPSYVIPFKLTKEDCEGIYKKKVNSFIFAPDYLKQDVVISKFRGIYMPYGIYKAEHHGNQVNKGTKFSHRSGDYDYYDDYTIDADIDAVYDGISFDLSSQFQDNFSQAIAPFNFREAQAFDVKYLSGFYADSSDVGKELYDSDAESVAEPMASSELRNVKEYGRYGCTFPKLDLHVTDIKTAYYPVYFLAIKSKNNTINYAVVNGQTGKCAVEMPIDYKKYILFSLAIAIPIFIVMNFFITLKPSSVAIFSLIMSIINLIISINQTSKLNRKEQKQDDKGYKFANANSEKMKFKKHGAKVIKLIISIIISAIVLLLNPVSDLFYYGAAILSLILVLLSFFDLVNQYNSLVGRKFEQLGKRGGDENA